jgi:transcriptional repressor NrdR
VRCPFCGSDEDRVVDSRASEDGGTIRRRRACAVCGRRFTTFERVEEAPLLVLKRDGSREQFELGKLVSGLEKACKNRPIPREEILRIASDIEEAVRARGQREVESQEVGIELLNALRELDPVAYMRFASVYKDFQDPADFERELEDLGSLRKTTPPKPRSNATTPEAHRGRPPPGGGSRVAGDGCRGGGFPTGSRASADGSYAPARGPRAPLRSQLQRGLLRSRTGRRDP